MTSLDGFLEGLARDERTNKATRKRVTRAVGVNNFGVAERVHGEVRAGVFGGGDDAEGGDGVRAGRAAARWCCER